MIKITKEGEPDFWTNFKRKNPEVNYYQLSNSEAGIQVRKKLREYLVKEQYRICCYCCRRIDMNNSLNEHVRPKDLYPNETMDYDNILASCSKDEKTCGPQKIMIMMKKCLYHHWKKIVKNILLFSLMVIL